MSKGKTISPMPITQEDTPYIDLIKKESENEIEWDLDSEGELAVDVVETPSDIIVRSAIAGVKPEELSIYTTIDTVTIRGRREESSDFAFSEMHVQECHWGSFSRTVILPNNIRVDDVVATLQRGILTVILPKSEGPNEVPVLSLDT